MMSLLRQGDQTHAVAVFAFAVFEYSEAFYNPHRRQLRIGISIFGRV